MFIKRIFSKTILLSISILLFGCGGGSSDNEQSVIENIDRPVFNRALASRAPNFSPSGNITDTRPMFTWTATPNATDYTLGYEDTETETNWVQRTETSAAANCGETCSLEFVGDSFSVGDEKVWWVRAKVAGVWQKWSIAHIFSIIEPPNNNNENPEAISPSGEISITNLNFSWTSVSQASRYQFGFENPSDSSNWSSYTINPTESACAINEESCTFTVLDSGLKSGDIRRWWVRAELNGVWGEWSKGVNFSINNTSVDERPFIFTVLGRDTTGVRFGRVIRDFDIKTNPNYSYNYNVDCNSDGIFEATNLSTNYTCVFDDITPNFTEHDISITGIFPSFYQTDRVEANFLTEQRSNSSTMIIDIKQWGSQVWKSMESAFAYSNLRSISATDFPNLSETESMRGMFASAVIQSGTNSGIDSLGNWDVSNIKNMEYLFSFARAPIFTAEITLDISNWDVSNVINMQGTFRAKINPDTSNWNVSKVKNMSSMFEGSSFNRDISGWDVSNVTSMKDMFSQARQFNQNIANWDVSRVNNMKDMFAGASNFNQNIGFWNTSNVLDMENMFSFADTFNQDLSNWDMVNVNKLPSFENTSLTTDNYDKLLIGWSSQPLIAAEDTNARVLKVGQTKFSANALAARTKLIDQFGWNISDGGQL